MQKAYLAGLSSAIVLVGALLSYYAYYVQPEILNLYQAVGSTVFWAGAFLLLAVLFLSGPISLAGSYVRTKTGAAIGAAYISAHLLLYGFVLEWMLVEIYRFPQFVYSSFAFVTTDVLYPASLANALVGDAFGPSINLQVPPIFELSLSVFAIFVAVVIDALILANVAKVKEIGAGSWLARSRAYVLMPLTGVFLGASCCMSLPVLLSIVAPSLTDAASSGWAFYVAYFVLPPLAIVVLKLNFDLASRVAAKTKGSPAGAPKP